jgi:co-chaperonin GroES (HSP10)
MKLQPFTNGIFFIFVEDSTGGRFINSTDTGLITTSQGKDQSNIARWGKVIALGPDVRDVTLDDYILIESGKWSAGFKTVEGQTIWKTDEDQVLAVSDKPTATY